MPKKTKKQKALREPEFYTQDERSTKVSKILLQLASLNLEHVLSEEVTQKIHRFIKTGEDYSETVDLPTYSRVLEICLCNDKNKKTYMNLAFKKIRIPEENNPINELNQLQETLFDDALNE